MKPVVRHLAGMRWDGIAREAYRAEGPAAARVTRQVLFGPDAGTQCELRYFELEPGGATSLERHAHVHQVVVMSGAGRCLVGDEVFELAPLDLVRVASDTWHQFRAAADSPLGFLCLVDRERDRGTPPSEAELAALRRQPGVAAFLDGG